MKNTKEELERFSSVLWALAEDFGGKISKDSLKLRFAALTEYSITQIQQAGTWLLKNREQTFPAVPTTKEIIDAINRVDNPQLALSAEARAEIQLQIVLDKLKNEGGNGTADFQDPITQQLMSRKWPYNYWASNVLESEITWFSKEFIKVYQVYDKNEIVSSGLLEAPGEKAKLIPAENLKLLVN